MQSVARRSSVQPTSQLGPRGLRSRSKLKEAARQALNKRGYRNLRINDVTKTAGVADGLFYRYFHDIREIVFEITREFFEDLVEESAKLPAEPDPYSWIFQHHFVAVKNFAANPGILACLFGLAGDYEEFGSIWKTNAHKWNIQTAVFLEDASAMTRKNAEHMAFVLGAMTEGVIYQSLVRNTEDLYELGNRPSETAEIISVMWYRAIFLNNPDPSLLSNVGLQLTGTGNAD